MAVHLKLIQYCKSAILQYKIKKIKIQDAEIGGNTIFFLKQQGNNYPQNQDSRVISVEKREGDVTRVGHMGLGVNALFLNLGGRYMTVFFIIIL